MQHSHLSELESEGHPVFWQALKYSLMAAACLVAFVELGMGILIAMLAVVGLVFVFMERVKQAGAQQHAQVFHTQLIGDGGSFPNDAPETKSVFPESTRVVLDGGSLERHRI